MWTGQQNEPGDHSHSDAVAQLAGAAAVSTALTPPCKLLDIGSIENNDALPHGEQRRQ